MGGSLPQNQAVDQAKFFGPGLSLEPGTCLAGIPTVTIVTIIAARTITATISLFINKWYQNNWSMFTSNK